jgi:hypothetical protein
MYREQDQRPRIPAVAISHCFHCIWVLETNLVSQGGGDLPTMSEAQQLAQALIVAAQNAASASAAHTTLSQQLMTQLSAQNSGGAPVAFEHCKVCTCKQDG